MNHRAIESLKKQRQIRRGEQGYILLVLLLSITLMSIGALAIVQEFKFQYQRDQEEEMIHRGVQYARAVKKFYKKFGRYPGRIEDLENTNNYRCLRKRYKDPMNRDKATGKERDFKLLHMTDVQSQFNPGAASMLPPGADANISADNPGNGTNGGVASAQADASAQPAASDTADQNSQSAAAVTSEPQAGAAGPGVRSGPGIPATATANPGQQVFGGAAIVGVASLNKTATIREFNKKNHYDKWQFIYDPASDRGGLLMTPNQPAIQGATPVNAMNGQQGQQQPQGFGQNGPAVTPTQQPQPQAPEQQ